MKHKIVNIFLLVAIAKGSLAQTGKVGINTSTPLAMLHVKDSSVLFTGSATLPIIPGNPPASGPGTRMMWYSDKAAFRAGFVKNTLWDRDSIGTYSIAVGYNTKAGSDASIAMGSSTNASGNASTAMGIGTIASAFGSTAMGNNTTASEHSSTAMGNGTTANGQNSTAIGINTTASGTNSIAMGDNAVASGIVSIALGLNTRASGFNATAMGYETSANGYFSTAIGFSTNARGFATTAIGMFNDSISAISQTLPTFLTPLFIVGNGDNNTTRRNAMVVLKNGNVGIGDNAPAVSMQLEGAVAYNRHSYTATTTVFNINVGNQTYLRIGSDGTGTAATRNVTLSDGLTIGQILIIHCHGNPFKLKEADLNLELQGNADLDMSQDDTLSLIWDGAEWVELHRSDN